MKNLYPLIFAFLIASNVNSQSSYTSGNYASGNYNLPMTTAVTGIIGSNFDTTGANITWDYSSLGMDVSGSRSTSTPSATGYQAPFIAQCILAGGGFTCLTRWNSLTNIGVVDLDSLDAFVFTLYDVMTMAKKNSGELIGNIKGLRIKDTNGITIPILAEYSESDTILTFPFTYQDSGKSYGEWGVDLNSIGQNIVYKVTYDRTWEVEGWGTLITPYQTHNNVLKVKTVLDQVDSVNFMGTAFGLPRKLIEYTWYDANYGLPVMRADGIEGLGVVAITAVQYYDLRVVGIDEQETKKTFSLFPNPTSDYLTIDSKTNFKNYRIIDTQGKLVANGTYSSLIDVQFLEDGMYVIQLIGNTGVVIGSNRFIKQ